MTNKTYQLPLEDLDNSGSSGSEFEPEEHDDDELPSEEYTVDTQDDEDIEDDATEGGADHGSGASGKTKKPKSNKVCAHRQPGPLSQYTHASFPTGFGNTGSQGQATPRGECRYVHGYYPGPPAMTVVLTLTSALH